MHCYTEEDIAFIKRELREFLHFYGYASHPDTNTVNLTAFFDFEEQTEEDLAKFNEFRKFNAATMAGIGTEERANVKPFVFN